MPSDSLGDRTRLAEILTHGTMELEGRLLTATNASFVGDVALDGETVRCIYKPVAGERPLWDFTTGTLADRERAAYLVSDAASWDVVPPTVLRDGTFGPGMCQAWVDVDETADLVDVIGVDDELGDRVAVLQAEDRRGRPVLLVHADDPALRTMSVMDAVINNADRKGGHVLLDHTGHLFGCDHGVSFHHENKLRTVLWGWADEPLRDEDLTHLDRLSAALSAGLGTELHSLLTEKEIDTLATRISQLRRHGRMPVPDGSWPAIPWPAF